MMGRESTVTSNLWDVQVVDPAALRTVAQQAALELANGELKVHPSTVYNYEQEHTSPSCSSLSAVLHLWSGFWKRTPWVEVYCTPKRRRR
jgi:hypothetical protein